MKIQLSLAVLFIGVTGLHAQNIGLNAAIFNAQGDFNKNIDRNPAGFSITYVHDLDEEISPWSFGGELGVAMYSNKEYQAPDASGNVVKIYEEDCFWTLHALSQYQLLKEPNFVVYAEGRIGMTTFFSEKYAEEEEADIGETFKMHGTAFNMGLGGGVRINLSGIFQGDGETYRAVWLDMALSANSGSTTTYRHATESTLLLQDASYRSLTNYTHLRIGVNYRIGA